MKTVRLDEIQIPENRQRRIFDPKTIAELETSIEEKGLLHPIVLRSDGKTLVAGERRLRALTSLLTSGRSFSCGGEVFLPENQLVPFVPLGELTEIEVEEAELDENLKRVDLSWQERNFAIARLHRLRTAQNSGRQTLGATALEVLGLGNTVEGGAAGMVRDALVIADNLTDPEIANASTQKEAMKIIARRAEAKHHALLRETFAARRSEHEIRQGNSLELIREVENASVDIIISDPPYGIDADQFGNQAAEVHAYSDSPEYAAECYKSIFLQASRICKPSAFLFLFCDIGVWHGLYDYVPEDWKAWPTPLIWNKGNGMLPVPDRGPRRCYEAIFFAYRGNRKWLATGSSDVLDIPGLPRPRFGAQKPVALFRALLAKVAQPGDTILDPYAGACPAIGAAKELSCRGIGFELNPEKVNWATAQYLTEGVVDAESSPS